jgi:hypothetical protein
MSETKHCLDCGKTKEIEDFGLDRKRPDGRHTYCRECRNGRSRARYATERDVVAEGQRWRMMKYRYGITKDEWLAMFASQNGQCQICKIGLEVPVGTRQDKRRTVVDHCHDTGQVRGLLCGECNLGIGYFKHDPALLQAALAYLG